MARLTNLFIFLVSICLAGVTPAIAKPAGVANVVLVHGGLVDGTVWRPVYDILVQNGYRVSIVQQPLTNLDADVAATQRAIDLLDGPVVLVGQSYGGSIITVAGMDPKVKALVYVAALQPDKGESAVDLNSKYPPASANDVRAIGTYYYYPPEKFADAVAADVSKAETDYLAASQMHMAAETLTPKLPAAAWHDKPSFAIVATDDKAISPELQRFMYRRSKATMIEVKASHAVFLSQPKIVAEFIMRAASSVK